MAGLSELGRLLHDEHLRTISLINELEGRTVGRRLVSRPLSATDTNDRELLEKLIGTVDRDLVEHFAFEEAVLFPIIWEFGAADMAVMLTHEHERISLMGKRLSALAARTLRVSDMTAEEWGEFREVAAEFAQASLFHIQKEEMSLIQRLGAFLRPDMDGLLAQRYAEGHH